MMNFKLDRRVGLGLLTLAAALCPRASAQTPDDWVSAHNRYRRTLMTFDGRPASSPDLTWSDALATDAKAWADRLAASGNLQHRPNSTQSTSPDARPYGENLAFTSAGGASGVAFVDTWVNTERGFFHPQTSTCRGGVCGHFTQVISQLSREVGCAQSMAADGSVYGVCNYTPHGNLTLSSNPTVYSELFPGQRAPVPGGPMFENLNRVMQLDLRFNDCLLTMATTIANGSGDEGATDLPAACGYTRVRAYDTGSNAGRTGYTGTADNAGGFLIGLVFQGRVMGVFGAVVSTTNPLRAVLVTGE